MRAYLLNDCSAWDAGSKATTEALESLIPEIGCKAPPAQQSLSGRAWESADLVICNGEGTMHHGGGSRMMELLSYRALEGTPTALVNTVWQEQPDHLCGMLSRIGYVSARDPWSQREILKHRDQCDLRIDLVVNAWDGATSQDGFMGTLHGARGVDKKNPEFWDHAKSTYPTWNRWVLVVSGYSLYVTGEYHGMLAAGLSGTPVVCQRSNSWKMEALADWAFESNGTWIEVCDTIDQMEHRVESGVQNGAFFHSFLTSAPRLTREDVLEGVK